MASKKDSCAHRCECKHARVKFCAGCAVVHCLDCKQEWASTPCARPHYDWTWRLGQAGYGNLQGGLQGGAFGGSVAGCSGGTTFTIPARGDQPVDLTPTIYCAHGTA